MPATPWDVARQLANVVAVVAQLGTLAFFLLTGGNFGEPTLIEPAGYAFVIWRVIYTGSIVHAGYQLLPSRRADPLLRRIGWQTAAANLGVAVWLVLAWFEWMWLTLACMLWIVAFAAPAFFRSARSASLSAVERGCVSIPLGLLCGWLTSAVFTNVAAALKASGWHDAWMPEDWWALGLMAAAGAAGVAGTITARGSLTYGSALVWAFVATAVANVHRGPHPLLAGVSAGLAVLVVGAVATARRARG
ncbi:MAG: hypothetical protein K2V38_18240 [Gemmataceae bacterium]|nr:hypothetical protein [Gemmataceae bacterium]